MHIETSGGIRVTVMPFYMGCRVRGGEEVGAWRAPRPRRGGRGDVACSDWHGVQPRTMTAVFHFVQEVQQTKVHWVSGGGGG